MASAFLRNFDMAPRDSDHTTPTHEARIPRQRRAAAATCTKTAAIGAAHAAQTSICAMRDKTREDPAAAHGPAIRRWLRRAMRRLDDVSNMLKGIAGAAGLPRKKKTRRGCRAGRNETRRRAATDADEKTGGMEPEAVPPNMRNLNPSPVVKMKEKKVVAVVAEKEKVAAVESRVGWRKQLKRQQARAYRAEDKLRRRLQERDARCEDEVTDVKTEVKRLENEKKEWQLEKVRLQCANDELLSRCKALEEGAVKRKRDCDLKVDKLLTELQLMRDKVKQTETDCSNRMTDLTNELSEQKRQFELTVTEQQSEIERLTALLKLKAEPDKTVAKQLDRPTETAGGATKSVKKVVFKKTSLKKTVPEKKALVKMPTKTTASNTRKAVKIEKKVGRPVGDDLHANVQSKVCELAEHLDDVVSEDRRGLLEQYNYEKALAKAKDVDAAFYKNEIMRIVCDGLLFASKCGLDVEARRMRADIEILLDAPREEGNVKVLAL